MSLEFLKAELEGLAERQRLRVPEGPATTGEGEVDLTSNDYLGLGAEPVSRETLLRLSGLPHGAGASRLVRGTREAHAHLESELAGWVEQEAALLLSSGFTANAGLLPALAGEGDLIVSDALNHASIIDGCRLSRARVEVVPHLDLEATARSLGGAARRRWVVTESYFSMDGDSPELGDLAALARRYEAGLVIDEAHALGVFGPGGRGLCAEAGVQPDVMVGTLGKAVGVQGAFIAGSAFLRTYLWNRARSFVYSTACAPMLAELVMARVQTAREADEARAHLRRLSARLRGQLARGGVRVAPGSHGPIVPIVVGADEETMSVAQQLRKRGIIAQPIRPPTVPEGTARLRLTLRATLSSEQVDAVAAAVIATCGA